jgi:hypothetical protein
MLVHEVLLAQDPLLLVPEVSEIEAALILVYVAVLLFSICGVGDLFGIHDYVYIKAALHSGSSLLVYFCIIIFMQF